MNVTVAAVSTAVDVWWEREFYNLACLMIIVKRTIVSDDGVRKKRRRINIAVVGNLVLLLHIHACWHIQALHTIDTNMLSTWTSSSCMMIIIFFSRHIQNLMMMMMFMQLATVIFIIFCVLFGLRQTHTYIHLLTILHEFEYDMFKFNIFL